MLKFWGIVLEQPWSKGEFNSSKPSHAPNARFYGHDAFTWHDVLLLPFPSGKLCLRIPRQKRAISALCRSLDKSHQKYKQNAFESQQFPNEAHSAILPSIPIPTVPRLNPTKPNRPTIHTNNTFASNGNQVRLKIQRPTKIFWLRKKLRLHYFGWWWIRPLCSLWWFVQGWNHQGKT